MRACSSCRPGRGGFASFLNGTFTYTGGGYLEVQLNYQDSTTGQIFRLEMGGSVTKTGLLPDDLGLSGGYELSRMAVSPVTGKLEPIPLSYGLTLQGTTQQVFPDPERPDLL